MSTGSLFFPSGVWEIIISQFNTQAQRTTCKLVCKQLKQIVEKYLPTFCSRMISVPFKVEKVRFLVDTFMENQFGPITETYARWVTNSKDEEPSPFGVAIYPSFFRRNYQPNPKPLFCLRLKRVGSKPHFPNEPNIVVLEPLNPIKITAFRLRTLRWSIYDLASKKVIQSSSQNTEADLNLQLFASGNAFKNADEELVIGSIGHGFNCCCAIRLLPEEEE